MEKKDDKLLDREVSNKNNKEFDIITAYNKRVASLKAKFKNVELKYICQIRTTNSIRVRRFSSFH